MKGEKLKGSVPYLQDHQKHFSMNMGEGGAILIEGGPKNNIILLILKSEAKYIIGHHTGRPIVKEGTKCDNVTIADMFLLAEIDQLDSDRCNKFPNLENWRKSMSSLPSYAKNIQGFHNSDMFKARTEWFKESIQKQIFLCVSNGSSRRFSYK